MNYLGRLKIYFMFLNALGIIQQHGIAASQVGSWVQGDLFHLG